MVAAVVAERQLVGRGRRARWPAAGGRGRCRTPAPGRPGPRSPRWRRRPPPGRRARSTGTRRRGARASTSSAGRGRRDDGDLAEPRQVAEDRALDAEVVGDDAPRSRAGPRRDRVRLGAGDGGDQVDAVGARLGHAPRPSGRPRRPAPNAPGIAPGLADVPGEAAGVDPGDARARRGGAGRRRGRRSPASCDRRRARSRTTTPRANGRRLSSSSALTP